MDTSRFMWSPSDSQGIDAQNYKQFLTEFATKRSEEYAVRSSELKRAADALRQKLQADQAQLKHILPSGRTVMTEKDISIGAVQNRVKEVTAKLKNFEAELAIMDSISNMINMELALKGH